MEDIEYVVRRKEQKGITNWIWDVTAACQGAVVGMVCPGRKIPV